MTLQDQALELPTVSDKPSKSQGLHPALTKSTSAREQRGDSSQKYPWIFNLDLNYQKPNLTTSGFTKEAQKR